MAMSYLDLLRQRRAEGDSLSAALSAIGTGVASSMEKGRTQAQERAKILQQQGISAAEAGQWEAAARTIPELQSALQSGYGIKPLIAPPVGAPILRQQLGPVPLGAPALPSVEVGRTFETPQTRANIRAGLMMQPPKPIEVSGALYNPETGTWSVSPAAMTPQARMDLQAERLRSAQELANERIRSAEGRAAAQRDLSMALAGMRIGAAQQGRQSQQASAINTRAANAFENFANSLKASPDAASPIVGVDVVAGPDGKDMYAIQMPLAYNEQDVIRKATSQGFSVSQGQGRTLLLKPTPLVAPRARVERRPAAPRPRAPVMSTAQGRSKVEKMALEQFMRETPGVLDEKTARVFLQQNPQAAGRLNQIKTGIAIDIDTAANAGAAQGVSPGAAPAKKLSIDDLLK